jgi:hypothetical protein
VVKRAWLVGTPDGGDPIAISVSEDDALRCQPETAALVRGRLRPGAHVMLDFPNEIMEPTGRVEPLLSTATAEPEPTNAPRWAPMQSWHYRLRMTCAVTVGLIGLIGLPSRVESGDADCGALPMALASEAAEHCTSDAAIHLVASLGLVAIGAGVGWFAVARRQSSDPWASTP